MINVGIPKHQRQQTATRNRKEKSRHIRKAQHTRGNISIMNIIKQSDNINLSINRKQGKALMDNTDPEHQPNQVHLCPAIRSWQLPNKKFKMEAPAKSEGSSKHTADYHNAKQQAVPLQERPQLTSLVIKNDTETAKRNTTDETNREIPINKALNDNNPELLWALLSPLVTSPLLSDRSRLLRSNRHPAPARKILKTARKAKLALHHIQEKPNGEDSRK